jgi:hypothetical protein
VLRGAKIEQAMRHAEKVQAKQLKADIPEIEADAKDAAGNQARPHHWSVMGSAYDRVEARKGCP